MFERFSFAYHVLFLLGLMVVAAAYDLWRREKKATRPREYSFIWIAGILGGLVGFANDSITSSISPEYFIFGKGFETVNDLQWRAGVYGFKAGLSAGVIGGAICLFVRPTRSGFSTEQMRQLLKALWMPLVGAVLLGLMLPIVAGGFDPMGISASLNSLLNANQIARFNRVWWIHSGLYAGMAIGLVAMMIRQKGDKPSV